MTDPIQRTFRTAEAKCPTCGSPDPKRHPAVQFEGEVQICKDPWHAPDCKLDIALRRVGVRG